MGVDWYFAVEERREEGWAPPKALRDPRRHSPPWRAQLTWLPRSRRCAVELFTGRVEGGEGSVVGMRAGAPPDAERSTFCRHYGERLGAGWAKEIGARWIDASDLLIECWRETRLLLGGEVRASAADLFGDGRRPLPRQALVARLGSPREVDELERVAAQVSAAIDQRSGRARHLWESAPPHRPVPVTWESSVVEILGADRAEAFERLAELAPLTRLRVFLYRA
ncbi:MAG: hypothetical protein VYE22_19230 [Myxococcota bacterium]|nr:hypothetical protein [Myxococcota bacterium]